jgi:N6-adenosine-specific RNA methylase IME4
MTLYAPLPTIEGGWRCVLADPPWRFQSNSVERPGKNPMRHYACMNLDDIAALPVKGGVADDALLFMWITSPFLAIGAHMPIMKAWGFKVSTIGFVWEKESFGTGYTTRSSCEFVMVGRRGRPVRTSNSIRQFHQEPKRVHSRKPNEIAFRIEALCDGPRLELFGRQSRANWTVWGDQSELFDAK